MADHNAPTPLDPTEFLTTLFNSGQRMWAPIMGNRRPTSTRIGAATPVSDGGRTR